MLKLTLTNGNVIEGEVKEIKKFLSSISIPKSKAIIATPEGATCPKCHAVKKGTLANFGPDKSRQGGLKKVCRLCSRKYQAQWSRNKKLRLEREAVVLPFNQIG